MFAQVQILTNGGPGDLTRTLVFQLYYHAFSLNDFGGADAMAVIFAIEGLLMFYLINRFVTRNRIEYM
jgi:ABC-type sugar transport system permease subunit